MEREAHSGDVRNKEVTRERILEAATYAFADNGYHDASMDNIVRRSGTSKGAIYFHFTDKETLFFALVERLVNALETSARRSIAQKQGAIAKIDAALQSFFHLFSRHRLLAKVILMGGIGLGPSLDRRLMKFHQRFAHFIKSYLDQAVAMGSIQPINTEVAASAWLGAINEIVILWLNTGQLDPLEETLPDLRALLLRSIGIQPSGQLSGKRDATGPNQTVF